MKIILFRFPAMTGCGDDQDEIFPFHGLGERPAVYERRNHRSFRRQKQSKLRGQYMRRRNDDPPGQDSKNVWNEVRPILFSLKYESISRDSKNH